MQKAIFVFTIIIFIGLTAYSQINPNYQSLKEVLSRNDIGEKEFNQYLEKIDEAISEKWNDYWIRRNVLTPKKDIVEKLDELKTANNVVIYSNSGLQISVKRVLRRHDYPDKPSVYEIIDTVKINKGTINEICTRGAINLFFGFLPIVKYSKYETVLFNKSVKFSNARLAMNEPTLSLKNDLPFSEANIHRMRQNASFSIFDESGYYEGLSSPIVSWFVPFTPFDVAPGLGHYVKGSNVITVIKTETPKVVPENYEYKTLGSHKIKVIRAMLEDENPKGGMNIRLEGFFTYGIIVSFLILGIDDIGVADLIPLRFTHETKYLRAKKVTFKFDFSHKEAREAYQRLLRSANYDKFQKLLDTKHPSVGLQVPINFSNYCCIDSKCTISSNCINLLLVNSADCKQKGKTLEASIDNNGKISLSLRYFGRYQSESGNLFRATEGTDRMYFLENVKSYNIAVNNDNNLFKQYLDKFKKGITVNEFMKLIGESSSQIPKAIHYTKEKDIFDLSYTFDDYPDSMKRNRHIIYLEAYDRSTALSEVEDYLYEFEDIVSRPLLLYNEKMRLKRIEDLGNVRIELPIEFSEKFLNDFFRTSRYARRVHINNALLETFDVRVPVHVNSRYQDRMSWVKENVSEYSTMREVLDLIQELCRKSVDGKSMFYHISRAIVKDTHGYGDEILETLINIARYYRISKDYPRKPFKYRGAIFINGKRSFELQEI